jgi:Protein of unknown function (DUF2975)
MTESTKNNIAWLSRLMAWLSTLGAVVTPLLVAAVYVWPGLARALEFDVDHTGALLNASIPIAFRLGALVFSLLAIAFTVWALWSLRSLFLLYAKGEVFSERALKLLNNVAIALFAGVIVSFVMHAPISILLTWPLGAGHRELSLELGSGDFVMLFSAGVVLVIARVMIEASRAAEENAKFV